MSLASLRFGLRMLLRDLRAGELNAIFAALAIAVAAISSVNLFAERVQRGLQQHATELLAADLLINSDHPVPAGFAAEARRRGLKIAQTTIFSSMAMHPGGAQLVTAKAVSDSYPLIGKLAFATRRVSVSGAPPAGQVWVDERLVQRTGLAIGQRLMLGESEFTVAGIVHREPDAALDLFSFVPRVLLNQRDLAATGLLANGSRARYRLQLAGPAQRIAAYRAWAEPRLGRGEHIEDINDARPEVRSAIQRAQRFLGVASMVAVALAVVAIGLATRRYVQRHLDPAAIMRCLGATQRWLFASYLWQFLLLGLLAGGAGVVGGALVQSLLVEILGAVVRTPLPPASPWLALQAVLIGCGLLLAFALPPLWQLRGVSTLRVLRRELGLRSLGILPHLLGLVSVGGLLYWQVADPAVAMYGALGFAATALLGLLLGWLLLLALRRLTWRTGAGWRYGMANLYRRQWLTVLQIVALGLGLMAMLVLTLVRGDLLQAWQQSVPADAPNRFIINIQQDQLPGMRQMFGQAGLSAPGFYPMTRARLLAVNGVAVDPKRYRDERAQNLAEREFNLSWSERLPADNRLVAGSWWDRQHPAGKGFSVEEGLAKTLGIRLGDRLLFDIGGNRVAAGVTSLRKVNWDNFRVNFFVIADPALLAGQSSSWICSFYLPAGAQPLVNRLVQQYPNLSVIDVSLILDEVQSIVNRVIQAVQSVFVLTLLAGLIVLQAALAATQDERLQEAAILRTLGASRRQIMGVMLAEYALIGALAGLVALAGAIGLGWAVSTRLLQLAYVPSPWLPLLGVGGGCALVVAVGWRRLRAMLAVPPLQTLNQLG